MPHLTLSIVAKTLFSADVESEASEIGDAMTTVLQMFRLLLMPFAEYLEKLPLPHVRRFEKARARLDTTIYGLIRDRAFFEWLERNIAALTERGLKIISGGTDSHVMLVDLRPKKATGVSAEKVLDRAGITANKNSIPGDPEKYTITSGVRLGSPAGTTRGFGVAEFRQIGPLIADVLDGIAKNGPDGDAQVEAQARGKVRALCEGCPIYRG